jgi:hypothetical protein
MSNAIIWPAATSTDTVLSYTRATRVTLADGQVVRPTLKTASLAVQARDMGFTAPLAVTEGSYRPAR